MTLVDDIRRDRKLGSHGPWIVGPVDDTRVEDGAGNEVAQIDGDYNQPDTWPIMEANTRRIARVPQLEEIALVADEMADVLAHLSGIYGCSDVTGPVLAALCKAMDAEE